MFLFGRFARRVHIFRLENCTGSGEFTTASTQLLKNANTSMFWRRGFGLRRQNVRVSSIFQIHVANMLCFPILFGSPSLPRALFFTFCNIPSFDDPGTPGARFLSSRGTPGAPKSIYCKELKKADRRPVGMSKKPTLPCFGAVDLVPGART